MTSARHSSGLSAYRPDIDGIRAIAVLSVVIYHLSPQWLPRGYLGVDVFFVLSGYLITGILVREMAERSFSILAFYERRVRRIMPALLAVLVCTMLVGSALLLPGDLVGLARSAVATLLFVANIHFWRDTNYFSPDAEQKPLLHMWSLSVEEQFYILFPVALLLLSRHAPRWLLAGVLAMIVASFALNVVALQAGGAAPAFFLLPTRMWELGAGAALALLPPHRLRHGPAASAIWLAGMAGLAVSLLVPLPLPEMLPAATLAVLATCCLIAAGGEAASPLSAQLIRFSLATRIMVFTGLISYSLYLWHWPVIVLAKYYLVRHLAPGEAVLILALSIALATLSWRFIEQPFRQRRMLGRVVMTATGGMAALVLAGSFLLLAAGGWPGRFSGEAARLNEAVGTHFRCPISTLMPFGASRACALHPADGRAVDAEVVLLGNSHAQMYAPAWREVLAERGVPGLLVPVNGCLPVVTANISRASLATAEDSLATVLALPKLRHIIIAMNWPTAETRLVDKDGRALDNRGEMAFIDALDNLLSRIGAAGHRAILIGPIAFPGWNLASEQSRRVAFGWPSSRALDMPQAEFEARHGAALAHVSRRSDVRLVRPDSVLCDGSRCDFVADGRSLFADSNHLAAAETLRFLPLFRAALDDMR